MVLAFTLTEGIVTTSILTLGGGVLAILNTQLGRRAERAKNEVAVSAAQVDVANKAMEGMEHLASQLRTDNDALRVENTRLAEFLDAGTTKRRIEQLERELAEERAATAALGRLLEKMKGDLHQ